ncbi:MAG TPA: hypothetical protein VEI97_19885, partial [bacterium]|nr:hypothetical protein [bacterium]
GNYDPATLGWQQGNIGAARNGWTGYGVLHQGQVATNTLEFPLASLESSELELTVAVLAKYNDPRQGASGTARKANRLPASPADITKFGYRMPHGALDVESIEFSGESGGFLANQVSSSTLSFHVVDWDARATASTSDPLSADPAVDTVVDGAQGTPALSVCIPGVTGSPNIEVFFGPNPTDDDSAFGGDAAADSGEPGDALFFSEAIGKGAGTGEAAGTYTGLVKVVDAATSDVLALDETLTPIAAHVPEPVTYQAFTVTMADPTWVQHYGEIAQPTSFTDVAVDSTGDIFAAGAFYGTVDFGQGPVASAGSADILLVNFSPTGQVEWVQTAGAGGLDSALGVAVAPTGDIWIAGRFQNAIQFSGGPTHVSAGGVDVFQTRFNSAGALQSSTRYGGTGDEQANAVACAVDGSFVYTVGQFTGATNMGTSPYTSAGGTDIFVRGGSSGNAVEQWSVVYGASGSDLGLSIVADPTGPTLYAGGHFSGTVNFGAGSRTSAGASDTVIVKLPATGAPALWDRVAGGTAGDTVFELAATGVGSVVGVGTFASSSINFGTATLTRLG